MCYVYLGNDKKKRYTQPFYANKRNDNMTSSINNVHLYITLSSIKIKDFLKTHQSLSIAERRRQWDNYINQPHVKKLIVEAIYRQGHRHSIPRDHCRGTASQTLLASIRYNPHNLVAGPHPCLRFDDSKDEIDYAIQDKNEYYKRSYSKVYLNDPGHKFEVFASMSAALPAYWHHCQNSSLSWIVYYRQDARPNSEDQEQIPLKKQKTSYLIIDMVTLTNIGISITILTKQTD